MNFIKNESKQKLRGGYYTPLDLAIFLARWIREIKPKNVLEPSCGNGIFFSAFSEIGGLDRSTLIGIEIDEAEASLARARAKTTLPTTKIYTGDFLKWALDNFITKKICFDAVIGNPPFIRYQYLPKIFQRRSEEIFRQLNLPFTKHTNAWVPFILASIAMLRPGGRLAMVVPAEIIHIPHARSLRTYLGRECHRIVIIDPQELWFENTLQGAVLLLAEKSKSPLDKNEGLGIYSVKDREFLNTNPSKVFNTPKPINGKTVKGKWTRALLDLETRRLLDKLSQNPNVYYFKDIAHVDVGIVTGANDYFLVTDRVVKQFHLSKWAHPMFGRSQHCPGIIYDKKRHQINIASGKPTNFIWFPKDIPVRDPAAKAYVQYGELQNLNTRYKCRVRSPWYSVPSVYSTEIGMLKRSYNIPRLILNKTGAFTTDTAYRVRSKISANKLVGNFINSLTALTAELEGRYYGGGVLEHVPSEIENLSIPIPKGVNINLVELDKSIRTLPTNRVLKLQDDKVLSGLGLSHIEKDLLLEAWQKLCNRRQRILPNLN